MLCSLFVLLVGLAAVSGFGSIPTGRHSSTSTSDEAINLAAEAAGSGSPKPKYVINPRKDPSAANGRGLPALDAVNHCYDLSLVDHCTDAPSKTNLESAYCGTVKNEEDCGHGNKVFRYSDSSSAWDLCGWDPAEKGGKGKCTSCGVSYKCHPKCLKAGSECTDPIDGSCFPFIDWPSPPPAPAPSRRLAETSHGRELKARRELRDKEEYEFNSLIRRELFEVTHQLMPPGRFYGHCDGCREGLSNTLDENGLSEKDYQCAPGINELFYSLQVNNDPSTLSNGTYGTDERDIPYGNFKVMVITCDLGEYINPTSGETIDGGKLIKVEEVCNAATGECANRYVPTELSIELFGSSFKYNPVDTHAKGGGQCKCTVKPKADDPGTRSPKSAATGTKSCKAPKKAAIADAGLSATTTGTVTEDCAPITCPQVLEGGPCCPFDAGPIPEGQYDCVTLRSAGARSAGDAASDCMVDMTNDITVEARTIGTKRGNLMTKAMKCSLSVWTTPEKPFQDNPQQNADCLCSNPRSSEEFNYGTQIYEGRGGRSDGIQPGDVIPKGKCFEVMPFKIW